MRLGLGMMRRSGIATLRGAKPRLVRRVQVPTVKRWETTDGRWRLAGTLGWVRCAADEPRTCMAPGGDLLGYLIEGAETFQSAPWHDPAAPHATTDPAYLAKTVAADAIAYAGGHSRADIHGGSGKAVEVTQGTTANGIFTANNITCATMAGDIVRVEMLFSLAATGGAAGTLSLRSAVRTGAGTARAVTLAHDAAGQITGWSPAPSAATFRAGWGEAGRRSDNEKVWFVWFETAATGTGTLAPSFGLPTAIAGRKLLIHDLRILCNPQTAPKAVPVLATAKTFAADRLVTDYTQPIGALFHRLGRCRTRITDGKLSIAPSSARSGPLVPYEDRIQIVASAETVDRPGILPNETQDIDFTPWLNPANFTLVLGPGYYNQRFAPTTNQACVNATITSAFRAEPALMAQLERVNSSSSFITGGMVLDDLILNSRASEIATQFEQVDLSSATPVNRFNMAGSFSAQRSLFVSHPVTHSRARAEAQADEIADRRVYVGSNYLLTNGGAGIACNLSGSHFWRWGRSFWFDVATGGAALAVNADDCFHDQIWSDAWYWETGTYTISFHRNLFGRFTPLRSDLWQSRREIEVDTGSGWTALSASGLTLSALPLGRMAHHAGTWNFAMASFTPDAVAGRRLVVRSWDKGATAAGVADRPGFQWHASQADHGSEDRFPATGDVYVIAQGVAPSPSTPWVRLTCDLGTWTSASTWVSGGNPAALDTGTHADSCQVNRTTCTVESMVANDCLLLGNAQGPFLTGNATMTGTDSDVKAAAFNRWIVISPQSWAFEFDYSRTPGALCQVSNALVLPMATRFRYADGSAPTPALRAAGVNNTLALANVFVGHKTGAAGASATASGTLTGAATQVRIGEIAGFAVAPPSGNPAISEFLAGEWRDPFTHAVRADIDPLDTRFAFLPQAEAATGIALNAVLAAARGTHARWNAVKARINRLHFRPDHVVSVPASTPVGSEVLAGLGRAKWMPLWSGAEKGHFALADGRMTVAKPLTGIDQCWLLQTDTNRTILVDIV